MCTNVTCRPPDLEAFVVAVLLAVGTPRDIAAEVGRHLVRANLSGHDSQGVIRLQEYVRQVERGSLIPAARPRLVRETEIAAVVDGQRGFGHFAAASAMEWGIGRARGRGVATASLVRAGHIGRLGEYTERAAAQGLIALLTAGSAGPNTGSMPLFGASGPFLGTNPWSIAIPGLVRTLVYDSAMSTVAGGQVLVAAAEGRRLPPDSLRDREGRPSRSPEDFLAGGTLVPLGGAPAGHKGSGLALVSALLGGLGMAAAEETRPTGQISGVFLLVLDPGTFGDAERYRALVDATLDAAAGAPPQPGEGGVLFPGQRAARARAHRGVAGITLAEPIWAELARLGERLGVAMPPVPAAGA